MNRQTYSVKATLILANKLFETHDFAKGSEWKNPRTVVLFQNYS